MIAKSVVLAVDMQRERLVARFPGAPIPRDQGNLKMVLVFQVRRSVPPPQQVSLCVSDHCSVMELLPSPIPRQVVAEVPLLPPVDGALTHVEVEVRGHNVLALSVVSLVVLQPRAPSPEPRMKRSTRSVSRSQRSIAPVPRTQSSSDPSPRSKRSSSYAAPAQSPVCQLQDWTVTMTELHWNDVIWPMEFQANYCVGTCPLEDEMYSNHALFRKQYTHFNGGAIPGPCCVPIAVEPLNVLVLVGHVITHRKHVDAKATACACL